MMSEKEISSAIETMIARRLSHLWGTMDLKLLTAVRSALNAGALDLGNIWADRILTVDEVSSSGEFFCTDCRKLHVRDGVPELCDECFEIRAQDAVAAENRIDDAREDLDR